MRDISKLPRWAQSEFERLQRDLVAAQAQAAAAIGATPSPIEVNPHRRHDDDSARLYLPHGAIVRFSLEGGVIDARLGPEGLSLTGHGRDASAGDLVIAPVMGNVIHARFEKEPA